MSTGYCNIQGRGIKFCQGSISELQQKLAGKTEEEITAWGAYWLAYHGLRGNCIVKGEDITFTFEDTIEWVEKLSADEILQIKAAFDSTQEYLKDVKEPAKKKTVKKAAVKK